MPLPPEHVLSAFHAETGATGTRRAQGDQLGPVWDNGGGRRGLFPGRSVCCLVR